MKDHSIAQTWNIVRIQWEAMTVSVLMDTKEMDPHVKVILIFISVH